MNLGKFFARTTLKILGWSLVFEGFPTPKGILVVYPHTSNLDFFIGILAKWSLGIRVCFLAKDSLFKYPLVGWCLRFLGGRPVVRNSPQGYVQSIAEEMVKADYFWLAVTPEGTRKHTPGWRSGFYHLAMETQCLVGFVFIDYQHKKVGVKDFMKMTGNQESDINQICFFYDGIEGRFPEKMAPIEFWSPTKEKNKV